MLKKKFLLVLFLLLLLALLGSCSLSYASLSQQDLEDYLNYYKSEIDNGSTEYGTAPNVISRLYDLYQNDYNQFTWVYQHMGNQVTSNMIITSYSGSWGRNCDIGSMFSLTSNQVTYYINYKTQYNPSTNTWTQTNENQYNTTGYGSIIAFSTEGYQNGEVGLLLNNNTICQKQWTYALPRDPSGIRYTNGNNWVTAFDIRIGQDWDFNNFDINIYTLDSSNNKTYRSDIVRRFTQATGSTEYIVDFDTTNLDNDNTYYIELKYQGQVWRISNGQRIIKGNGANSGDSPSGGGSSVDLTETNQKIDLVNSSIIAQTQAILSGDKEIVNAIQSGDTAIIHAITDIFSGDLSSGDLIVLNIDDPSNNFFDWLLTQLQAFFLDFNNTTLIIPIWNEDFEISSDIFILTIEPLKTFISIGWWFICGVPLLKWVRHVIETIRSGNIPQVDDKSDLLGNVL